VAGRTPMQVARALADLGDHLRTWRKLNGLTSALAAERAGISRQTLRDIETGTGTVSTGNLLRVLRVLGILPAVVAAADPLSTDVGRLRAGQALPQRVRPRRPTS